MNARTASIVAAAVIAGASAARSGHELPVYPSYYPHEIEIATIGPEQAGARLVAGKLHAYVAGSPHFNVPPPDTIGSVPSLGSFVIVRLNPGAPAATDEASACAAVGAIVSEMASGSAELIAHPYPVTPFHGDYLHHADLAEAARARLAAGGTAAAGKLRVKAEGALARSLIPPGRRTEGGHWDVQVTDVDARDLVSSSTTAMNGWLGPRWSRTGWFHAYRLLAETVTDRERRKRLEADLERLQAGSIADAAERINVERDLVERLTSGCRAVVAGYTVKRDFFNVGFSAGIENIAYDALEGLESPMFLRTVKLKDFPWNGWLQLGTGARPDAAWNPVGGFTGAFGRLMWFAVGDPAAVPSPYDHAWVLNRFSEVQAAPRP